MNAPNAAGARQSLLSRRRKVLARYWDTLKRAEEELDTREIEDVENAAELWDARLLATLSATDLRVLTDIYAALERIDDGHYGTCVVCNRAIEQARLDALPEASRCIECAEAIVS